MKSLLRLIPALVFIGCSFCAYQLLHPKFTEDFHHHRVDTWNWFTERVAGNGANMIDKMVRIEDSTLTITLDINKSPGAGEQRYASGGLWSPTLFKNGIISFRFKNEIAPGTASAFNLVPQWKPGNRKRVQMGISFLGSKKGEVILSTRMENKLDGKSENIVDDYTHTLPPSTENDYHDYAIKWSEDEVVFYVDGQEEFASDTIDFDEPMHIEILHWTANKDENPAMYTWLGPVEDSSLPSRMYCKMIKVNRVNVLDEVFNPFKF